jgi:hypothetical protein
MIKHPGRPPSYLENVILQELILKVSGEEVVIHHITQDTIALGASKRKIQLEIERRLKDKVSFERLILEN